MQNFCKNDSKIMLISFSIENFLSIKELQTLSFEANSDKHLESINVFLHQKHRLLRASAVYGPNASGKSNLMRAMAWMRDFVIGSSKEGQVEAKIGVTPFALSSETENKPSYFEIRFFIQEIQYRYGFQVDDRKIHAEWLFRRRPEAKEVRLFTRKKDEFSISPDHFNEGIGLQKRTRPNALFLSVCSQFNGQVASDILRWMRRFRFSGRSIDRTFFYYTAGRLGDPKSRGRIIDMARHADLGICDLSGTVKELEIPASISETITEEFKKRLLAQKVGFPEIKVHHWKYGADNSKQEQVQFDLEDLESKGTQRFIALAGPICLALDEGSVFVVDEFESMLHPLLSRAIVSLFLGPQNSNNAQLLFATHDTLLMDPDLMRRDQIWFTNKDEYGATSLFSLAEFDSKKVRASSKFNRQYLMGIFGAIPNICLDLTESASANDKEV